MFGVGEGDGIKVGNVDEEVVWVVGGVGLVCVGEVVYEIMDVVLLIVGVKGGLKCLYFREEGVEGEVGLGLLVVEMVDGVDVDV